MTTVGNVYGSGEGTVSGVTGRPHVPHVGVLGVLMLYFGSVEPIRDYVNMAWCFTTVATLLQDRLAKNNPHTSTDRSQ